MAAASSSRSRSSVGRGEASTASSRDSATPARSRRDRAVAAACDACSAAPSRVSARESHPARGEQHVDVIHPLAECERALDEPRGLLRLVPDDDTREAGQGRDQPLQVARRLRLRHRFLEAGTGERPLPAPPVDLAQLLERVRDHARAEPLVEILGRLEIGDGLVEPPELRERLTAVVEREPAERSETGEVGEAQREIELGDRLLVRALLDVP